MSDIKHEPICILVHHDADCPGAHGDPFNCNCTPEIRMVGIDELASTMVQDSKRLKAAKDAASQAVKKAKRGGKPA